MIRVHAGIVKRVLPRLQMPEHELRLGFFSTRDCPTESALQHGHPQITVDRFVIHSIDNALNRMLKVSFVNPVLNLHFTRERCVCLTAPRGRKAEALLTQSVLTEFYGTG